MSVMTDPQSSYAFDFNWAASGATTITHNLALPLVNGSYGSAAETIITDGDAYIHNVGTNSFDVYATSTTGAGHFKPKVRVGDFS